MTVVDTKMTVILKGRSKIDYVSDVYSLSEMVLPVIETEIPWLNSVLSNRKLYS